MNEVGIYFLMFVISCFSICFFFYRYYLKILRNKQKVIDNQDKIIEECTNEVGKVAKERNNLARLLNNAGYKQVDRGNYSVWLNATNKGTIIEVKLYNFLHSIYSVGCVSVVKKDNLYKLDVFNCGTIDDAASLCEELKVITGTGKIVIAHTLPRDSFTKLIDYDGYRLLKIEKTPGWENFDTALKEKV